MNIKITKNFINILNSRNNETINADELNLFDIIDIFINLLNESDNNVNAMHKILDLKEYYDDNIINILLNTLLKYHDELLMEE